MTLSERLAILSSLTTECECGHQKIHHQPKCLWVSNYIECLCKGFEAKNL